MERDDWNAVVLMVLGLVVGGAWTFFVGLGESLLRGTGLATLLTAMASVLVFLGGLLLLVRRTAWMERFVTGDLLFGLAFCLLVLALCGYIGGVAVCTPRR